MQKGLEDFNLGTFLLRNKEPGAASPPLGNTHAVQRPASRGGARLECDSWALRDALLVECDSPDTLSPPKASASTPPSAQLITRLRSSGLQLSQLKPRREEWRGAGREEWRGAGRATGRAAVPRPCLQGSPLTLLWPLLCPCPEL